MTTNIKRRGGTVAGCRLPDGLHPDPERTEEEDKDDDELAVRRRTRTDK